MAGWCAFVGFLFIGCVACKLFPRKSGVKPKKLPLTKEQRNNLAKRRAIEKNKRERILARRAKKE